MHTEPQVNNIIEIYLKEKSRKLEQNEFAYSTTYLNLVE